MRFSIITATYNSESVIKSCIESIINQSFKDIEYIIVDGGSKDNTLGIVNDLKDKFNEIKIISEPDFFGIYDALNKGISTATGDIVGFLNLTTCLIINLY